MLVRRPVRRLDPRTTAPRDTQDLTPQALQTETHGLQGNLHLRRMVSVVIVMLYRSCQGDGPIPKPQKPPKELLTLSLELDARPHVRTLSEQIMLKPKCDLSHRLPSFLRLEAQIAPAHLRSTPAADLHHALLRDLHTRAAQVHDVHAVPCGALPDDGLPWKVQPALAVHADKRAELRAEALEELVVDHPRGRLLVQMLLH